MRGGIPTPQLLAFSGEIFRPLVPIGGDGGGIAAFSRAAIFPLASDKFR